MRFHIEDPCSENWDAMTATNGGRHCERCAHEVIDLSRLTRRQATAQVSAKRASEYVCVRLRVAENGQPTFRPEPAGRTLRWAAGLGLAAALASGCEGATLDKQTAELVTEPPCSLPPEFPIGATEPELETGQVEVEVPDAAVEPTAEQRALTRSKHEPPQVQHVMGRMPAHVY